MKTRYEKRLINILFFLINPDFIEERSIILITKILKIEEEEKEFVKSI